MAPTPPSLDTGTYWIEAYCPVELQVPRPGHAKDGPGKWLLFVKRADVDETWLRIVEALEKGLLGGHAKVATARPNPNEASPGKHVICVYTSNAGDEEDVMRVREALRQLGFVGKLAYKADTATRQGLYQNAGSKRISKYYC